METSGAEYTVIGVDYSTLMLRWHLRTINLAIAADLKDRLTYYAPKNEINSAGKRVATYWPRYRNIACRFQPLDTNPEQWQGRRLNVTNYEVYCAREMDITTEGYLKDQNGNQYRIESWRGVERLEDLFTIVVSL